MTVKWITLGIIARDLDEWRLSNAGKDEREHFLIIKESSKSFSGNLFNKIREIFFNLYKFM